MERTNKSLAVFLINKDVRAIRASYEADAPNAPAATTMFKTMDRDLKVGDFIIVPTNTRHLMTVCWVKEVDVEVNFESTQHVDWVIGTIDKTGYKQVLLMEGRFLDAIAKGEKRQQQEKLRETLMSAVDLEEVKALPIYTDTAAPTESASATKTAGE